MAVTGLWFLFVFLPIALLIGNVFRGKAKEYALLALSLLFYALGSPRHFFLILILMVCTVTVGRVLTLISGDTIRRIILIIGISMNLGALFYFKYFEFALNALNRFFGFDLLNGANLLPLGISFYSFKAVSYLVDIYTGKTKLSTNPVHDALYLTFFPQIQAGPIDRYDRFRPVSGRTKAFSEGAFRFMIGFTKKILVANVLNNVTGEIFAAPFELFSVSYAWLGSICYSLQLYLDFSGYSDIAVGLSRMLGFECMENFNYPYLTETVSKFWKRWHISLSEWFRDYVYIPLGGSKTGSRVRTYLNLFIVWILTGIWHGTSWNYVAWGLGYFLAIAFERAIKITEKPMSGIGKAVYRIVVLLFINAQWVLFNSGGLKRGLGYLRRMIFCIGDEYASYRTLFLLKDYLFFILAAILFCFPVVSFAQKKLEGKVVARTVFDAAVMLIAVAGFVLSVSFLVSGYNNPFAYANF